MPIQTTPLVYADGTVVNVLTTNRSAIPYIEFLKYAEVWKPDGLEATRYVACLWSQRYDFIADMLGTAFLQPGNMVGGQTTNLARFIPEAHPEYQASDGTDFLYAADAQLIDAIGLPADDQSDIAKALSSGVDYETVTTVGDSNMVAFNIASYAITYRPVNYDVYSDTDTPSTPGGELGRYVIRTGQYGAENLPIPGNTFKWVPQGGETADPIPEAPPKVFPSATLHYQWIQVPQKGFLNTNIDNAIGTVNATAFDNGFFTPGQLLMLPPEYRLYRSPIGDRVYDITLQFLYRASGHNFLYRGGAVNAFREVSTDGTTYPQSDTTHHIYAGADWNDPATGIFILPTV